MPQRREESIPDDRELPLERIDPDALFDAYPETPPRDRTPLAEDAFQRHIGQIDYGSHEQTASYAAAVQAGQQAEQQLAEKRRRSPLKDRLEAAVHTGEEAQEELFLRNLRLAAWVARMTMNLPGQTDNASKDADQRIYRGAIHGNLASFSGAPLPLADRIQLGTDGLIKAIEKYRPAAGGRFSTYAMYHIENAIVRGIYDYGMASGARLPVHIAETARKIQRSEDYLASKYNYDRVPDAAIAEDLDISPETVMDLRNLYLTHDAASLEEQLERPTGTH
ncbi:MAG TPA: sigma factor, partial [Candidatus Saccharimonadales bacterium]|nr:sigma factor [Candidatus Saccharimonadales bacterium]